MRAKAIVMEICGREAVVLNAEGSFVRIRNNGYAVGQEIVLTSDLLISRNSSSRVWQNRMIRYAAIAACIALLIIPVFSLMIMNSQSYGYVSVDVNPSIAYHTNRFDKVVKVTPLNSESEALIATIGIDNLEGEAIEVALSVTIQALDKEGYLDGEQAGLIISTSSKTEKASLALHEKIKEVAANDEHLIGAHVATAMVSHQLVEQAAALGTTAGKLKLIQDIGDTVDVEKWLDKSVAEIQQAVKENNAAPEDDPANPNRPQESQTQMAEDTADVTRPEDGTTPNDLPVDTSQGETTEPETEAEVIPETEESLTLPETEPNTEPEEITLQDTQAPLESETEADTIPPEPDKEKDPESWWEWFWQWIMGKL